MKVKGMSLCGLWLIIFSFITFPVFAQQQDIEKNRRDTIKYGTENEIASLVNSLRTENADYLDEELITIAQDSKNSKIVSSIFAFFGEREKNGLESRAIKAVNERDGESNDTVIAAIDYLGRIKSADAVPDLIKLIDTEERRFMNNGFRALGRAGASNRQTANEAAEFLIDYYENRTPSDDLKREIITAIGATGSSLGIDLLSDIAKDTSERIPLRIAAVDALSKIGDQKCLDPIIISVSANDPNVRSAAVAALGPFSGIEADNAILEAFRDSYYRSRIAAAQASRTRRLAAAVPFLKFRAERDEVPAVREESIRALGEIGNAEANETLKTIFEERKNSDRLRILSADMLMKNIPDENFDKLVQEMDDARRRNQTGLYNGLLKVVGEASLFGDTAEIANITSRFLKTGTVIEKLYALDMIANNNLRGFNEDINTLTQDRNETIARKARRTLEALEDYSSGKRQRAKPRENTPPVQRTVDTEQTTE
ncbi:MAG: HEAT repeat domain-containing protein [Treponema sp.]|nr:HEAT repeat domain-containing protein [Treponema sp.]